jgi:transglutaminase-like putative cysteine protease
MKKSTLFLGALGAVLAVSLVAKEPSTRTFHATYVGTIAGFPATAKHAEIWIPLPSDNAYQTVSEAAAAGPGPYTIGKDSAGNRVAHFSLEGPFTGKETEVRAAYNVTRREVNVPNLAIARAASSNESAFAEDLKPNRMVPLTPRVKSLADQVTGGKTDPVAKAKAIYDYLVDNGTYDKTTPGWGKGDSERFCDVKKGNCTDFHSAFMALARSEKIPVRFFIGFPLKDDKEGTIPGYHCWAFFHAQGAGWVPVDASDAAKLKDPTKKAYLFGNLDADRFDVSTGRDLTLSPPQKDGPVNFLIYPYVEVDGKAFTDTKVRLEYRGL